ncbi:hypothetical protein E2C01_068222 [Portunus trituberculatus]|uniref:Uncharacterized protein n=1 Tax=Portunus trituberculatus TaxID=210409 RepID=A0A5B7HLV9_PORTR|nr:hypothetical protein [Portunus trituberculatus]
MESFCGTNYFLYATFYISEICVEITFFSPRNAQYATYRTPIIPIPTLPPPYKSIYPLTIPTTLSSSTVTLYYIPYTPTYN